MGSSGDMEELTYACSNMNLTEGEQEEVQDGDEDYEKLDTKGKPSLLGRLYTTKPYRKSALTAALRTSWRSAGWVRFRTVKDDVFLILFEKEEDRDRALSDGPWIFSKSVFIIQKVDGVVDREQAAPVGVLFWVHVFGLPPLGHTENMGRKLGLRIGKVHRVDTRKKVSWNGGTRGAEYIRILAEHDVRKPLVRGAILSQSTGGKRWISFRYERLPNFCYDCGCLGHVSSECSHRSTASQYGDWLRAYSEVQAPSGIGTDGNQGRDETMDGGGAKEAGETRTGEAEDLDKESFQTMERRNNGSEVHGGIVGIKSALCQPSMPTVPLTQLWDNLHKGGIFVFKVHGGKETEYDMAGVRSGEVASKDISTSLLATTFLAGVGSPDGCQVDQEVQLLPNIGDKITDGSSGDPSVTKGQQKTAGSGSDELLAAFIPSVLQRRWQRKQFSGSSMPAGQVRSGPKRKGREMELSATTVEGRGLEEDGFRPKKQKSGVVIEEMMEEVMELHDSNNRMAESREGTCSRRQL